MRLMFILNLPPPKHTPERSHWCMHNYISEYSLGPFFPEHIILVTFLKICDIYAGTYAIDSHLAEWCVKCNILKHQGCRSTGNPKCWFPATTVLE